METQEIIPRFMHAPTDNFSNDTNKNFEESFARITLLESIRARAAVAPISVIATFLPTLMMLPVLISQSVSWLRICLWVLPIAVTTLIRTRYSRHIFTQLERLEMNELNSVDRHLRLSSIINQALIGSGIWIIHSPQGDNEFLSLFVTLIIIMFSIGVTANLFSDFKSFVLSAPLLIGQPALYWLLQDGYGLAVGTGMTMALILMIALVHRGSKTFRDSISIRFEKDILLKRVEDESRKTSAALLAAEAANESKLFFMAAASHDIKQPLYALGMLTDTLMMSELPEASQLILRKQKQNIEQMSAHFDALMDLSKFDGGAFKMDLSELEMRPFLLRISHEFEPQCQNKSLSWHMEVSPDIDLTLSIMTDEQLLLRVFRNLLNNAVRYTESGQVRCNIDINQSHLEISIVDTGPGIPKVDQSTVFDRFVRLDHRHQEKTGAGLGLAIVKQIDFAMGLNLELVSTPGVGTQFRFSLAL